MAITLCNDEVFGPPMVPKRYDVVLVELLVVIIVFLNSLWIVNTQPLVVTSHRH